jgi:hypothetical protein
MRGDKPMPTELKVLRISSKHFIRVSLLAGAPCIAALGREDSSEFGAGLGARGKMIGQLFL